MAVWPVKISLLKTLIYISVLKGDHPLIILYEA